MSPPDVPSDVIATRFADYGQKLADYSGTITAPDQAGAALMIAGDVLRRTQALGSLQRVARETLGRVDGEAARAFVQSIDVSTEHKRLEQAMTDAFESMLAETDEGITPPTPGATGTARALAGLAQRDRLASLATALTEMKHDAAVTALLEKLAQVDAGLSQKARMLVGLNEARRAELDALNATEKASSWWFGARSKCDRLRALYSEEAQTLTSADAHVENCAECQRDLKSASGANKPAHVNAESLARRESGTATSPELRWMDQHAKSCAACKRAIEALSVALDA